MRKPLFVHYKEIIENFISESEAIIAVDPPRDESFGDFSTNAAMVLAKKLRKKPIDLAEEIANKMRNHNDFEDVIVKNPGFINWKIPQFILKQQLIESINSDFGKCDIGNGIKINIEYVSANPTGPLHAGHARGAISGDVLANLLNFVGYNVTKEYYVNDAGKQIEILAKSLYHRYLEQLGKVNTEFPQWAYPGEYLIDTAKKVVKKYGDSLVEKSEGQYLEQLKKIAIADMMKIIKEDLSSLGIHHDLFFSEKELVNTGAVEKAVEYLEKKGLIYRGILDIPKGKEPEDWEPREQLLFKSTQYGDEIDRPLQKSDGSWTYFASDIAYHKNKIDRNFDEMIDFWGADHGGYIKRMQAAVSAISDNKKKLDVKISQIVRFMDNGKEVKMSKRSGTFITVRDVINAVGKDVIRFIMLTRRDDAPLDFDFNKVVEQSRENPVFYVQYAYARTHSVFKQFKQTFPEKNINEAIENANLDLLEAEDFVLVKTLCNYPRQIAIAARNREPHRLAFYLSEVAAKFHALWNYGKENTQLRFISADDYEKTCAKMFLLRAVQNII
ncbi:MAG: arginine--tRNA ligase, partial [Alphaproteobacteria bacterium]|nr:arginine--tRNA ligase [Alphaproteobacteria bacterium]